MLRTLQVIIEILSEGDMKLQVIIEILSEGDMKLVDDHSLDADAFVKHSFTMYPNHFKNYMHM